VGVRRHAATGVVLALLVGTAVAFAETERLKLQPTPIEESFIQHAFSPNCRCAQAQAQIRLRLHRADTATVRIRNASDGTVRVLVDRRRLPRGRTSLEWDGRDDGGTPAPDGLYHVDVRLSHADRTFRLPQSVVLDTVAPTVRLVSFSDTVRVGERVRIRYRVSEAAHAVLYVNGKRRLLTHTKLRAAKLQWRPRHAGRYRLQLAAVDLAGNLGRRSPVFVVQVTSSA
jgi:hypothetical protein